MPHLRSTILLIALSFSLVSSAATVSAQSTEGIGAIFESKQEKYRKAQLARDKEEAERRALEESVHRQQAELQRLQAEKNRLRGTTANQGSSKAAVRVYVADNCDPCLKTLGFLDALGHEYTVLQIDSSNNVEELYLQRFGRGSIPVVETDEASVRGYNPQALRSLFTVSKEHSTAAAQKSSTSSNNSFPAARGASTAPTEAPKNSAAKNSTSDFDVSPTLE